MASSDHSATLPMRRSDAGRGERVRRLLCRIARSAVAIALFLASAAAMAEPLSVAIVTSSGSGPFGLATEALTDTIRRRQPALEITGVDLRGSDENGAAMLRRVRHANPALIITIGSLATATVLAEKWSIPLVFSMVLYPERSGYVPGSNVTGVTLDVPLGMQFGTIRHLLPSAHRLGVLYHREETGWIVAAARDEATRHGFTLTTKEIGNPSDVPVALPSFLADIDVVWMVADSHVLNPQSTDALMLQSMRMWVPVFGLSRANVQSGAVAAVGCDYADIGVQSAELALRVLAGDAAAGIAPVAPRKLLLTLNQRSARHLNITIPAELEQQASEVIR